MADLPRSPSEIERHLSDGAEVVRDDGQREKVVRMGHARVDRRTALPIPAAEHPAERAAREYASAATVGNEAALRARIAELETDLAGVRRHADELIEQYAEATGGVVRERMIQHLQRRVERLEAENARLRLQRHDADTFALSLAAGPSPERQRIAELEALAANLSDRLAACSECLGRAAERRLVNYATATDALRRLRPAERVRAMLPFCPYCGTEIDGRECRTCPRVGAKVSPPWLVPTE